MKREFIYKKATFGCIIILGLAIASCQKSVQVNLPVTQIATATVFSSNATATAALINIYANMNNGVSWSLENFTGLSSDELSNYNTGTYTDCYLNSLSAASDGTSLGTNFWSAYYNFIFQANSILEGLQNNNGVNASVKQQLTGEVKFLRAFWHFYLTNLYGDIPIITTSDYRINGTISRSPQSQVYQQIITDLKDAKNLLNNGFVDASDTTTYSIATAERIRPTKWAASAMLARVYLYTNKYDSAEIEATNVINNTAMFSLLSNSNINNVFLKNSTEAIWQLSLPPATFYTSEGSFFILTAVPSRTSISNQLLNSFENGDSRKTNWVKSITALGNTYYYPFKYQSSNTSTSQKEYNMVLRLAEQYLIRAEARAQQSNIAGAQADLNVIRIRANLPPTTAIDNATLLTAIAKERQVELFTEWGDRWLNLKRTGTIDAVMNVVTPLKGGIKWQSYQALYPLSLTELSNNPNMTQTPGY